MPRRFIHRHQPPHRLADWAKATTGVLAGLSLIVVAANWTGSQFLLAPLAASTVLLFGLPNSPASQPVNVIAGHFLASVLALALDQALPEAAWSVAAAVGIIFGVLALMRLTHPPAGAIPIIVMTAHPPWTAVLVPALAGPLILIVTAMLVHRLPPRSTYPLPLSPPRQ